MGVTIMFVFGGIAKEAKDMALSNPSFQTVLDITRTHINLLVRTVPCAQAARNITVVAVFSGTEDKVWPKILNLRLLPSGPPHAELLQVRAALLPKRGYEVEGEEACHVLAFHTPEEAVEYAVLLQWLMRTATWSPRLLGLPGCSPVVGADGRTLMSGPQLKIGMCTGDAQIVQPSMRTGRVEYFGPLMNHAARTAARANGGQILLHGRTHSALDLARLDPSVSTKHLETITLKGIKSKVDIFEVSPPSLACSCRVFSWHRRPVSSTRYDTTCVWMWLTRPVSSQASDQELKDHDFPKAHPSEVSSSDLLDDLLEGTSIHARVILGAKRYTTTGWEAMSRASSRAHDSDVDLLTGTGEDVELGQPRRQVSFRQIRWRGRGGGGGGGGVVSRLHRVGGW